MIHVIIAKDDTERVVEVPEELKKILEENEAVKSIFFRLTYTNQKEYAEWIKSAKKMETRNRRLNDSIQMLLKGIKHP